MKKSDVWMPVFIGDYLADTGHLNATEHGAYLLLLFHYWRNGPLRDDDDELSTIARVDRREWDKVGRKVRRFFAVGDDGLLHQKRLDAERERAGNISAKRSAASAERWNRAKPSSQDANGDAIASPNASDLDMSGISPSPSHKSTAPQGAHSAEPGADSQGGEGGQTIGQRLYGEGLVVSPSCSTSRFPRTEASWPRSWRSCSARPAMTSCS
jgi:uncharacterized protein YdaU (DUF1376 family)